MGIGLLSFIGCCSSHHLKGIRLLLMYWLLSLPLFEGYRVVVYLLIVVAQLCVGWVRCVWSIFFYSMVFCSFAIIHCVLVVLLL